MGFRFALVSTDGDIFDSFGKPARASSRVGDCAGWGIARTSRPGFPAADSGNRCTGRARVALASFLLEG
jgi:hypothetical protein